MSKLKTVFDAVNDFRGDLSNSPNFSGGESYLFYNPREDYIGTSYHPHRGVADVFHLCTVAEFNALIEGMSRHAGDELYERYVRVAKTPLEKETKPDYTSLEFWEDAPDDMVTLGAIGKAGSLVFYNDDNYKYVCGGIVFPFKKDFECTFDFNEVAFIACRPQSTPIETPEEKEALDSIVNKPLVYTQEMADNSEYPSVGMKCIAESKGAVVGGSYLVTVSQINKKGQFACIDDNGDYLIHYPNEDESESFKPIDQRTKKEKAIDKAYNNLILASGQSNFKAALSVIYDEWVGE